MSEDFVVPTYTYQFRINKAALTKRLAFGLIRPLWQRATWLLAYVYLNSHS